MKINNWIIESDQNNWILKEQRTSNEGKTSIATIGFFSSIDQLVARIGDETMKAQLAESKDIRELVHRAMAEMIKTAKATINK